MKKEIPEIHPNSKILIVEDDEYARLVISKFLKRSFSEATIEIATSFEGIEDLIVLGHFDLILLDANLYDWGLDNKYDGYGGNLIPIIKKSSPNSTIMSISDSKESNQEMKKLGADLFFKKSVFDSKEDKFSSKLKLLERGY